MENAATLPTWQYWQGQTSDERPSSRAKLTLASSYLAPNGQTLIRFVCTLWNRAVSRGGENSALFAGLVVLVALYVPCQTVDIACVCACAVMVEIRCDLRICWRGSLCTTVLWERNVFVHEFDSQFECDGFIIMMNCIMELKQYHYYRFHFNSN